MNTLTNNRILQKGDEYLDPKGAWKPVPENDIGLQVAFAPYAEVRRPSENQPISPDGGRTPQKSAPAKAARIPAKAEKEKSPVPTPSGTGESPHFNIVKEFVKDMGNAGIVLPTVVSHKAHAEELRETPETVRPTEEPERVASPTPSNGNIKIPFPKVPKGSEPVWTGRNGTFSGYAMEATLIHNDNIMLTPVGKRGTGNGCIQFPVAVIPQLIDWLLRHQK